MRDLYRKMVEGIPVPEGQAERIRAAALAAEPERRRPFRPWRHGKKVLLAAALAGALLVTAAASGIAEWDPAFLEIFGAASQDVPGGSGVFQEVNAVSVCGDVTLTVRQAIGDKRNLYLLLDYQLPEDADLEAAAAAEYLRPSPVLVYKGQAITWEDVQSFSDVGEVKLEFGQDSVSGQVTRVLGFDPETRTMSILVECDLADWSLAARLLNAPVTLVAGPPAAPAGEGEIPLADQLAVVSFKPSFDVDPAKGSVKTENASYKAEVSPLSLHVQMEGDDLASGDGNSLIQALQESLVLRFRDGTEVPAAQLEQPGGSSHGGGSLTLHDDGRTSGRVSFDLVFEIFLDPADVEAVLVGDVEIPVS